jgi:hypothetical protein
MRAPLLHSGEARAAMRTVALIMCIVAANAAAGGCSAFCPAPSPLVKAGPGEVRIRWPACRTLQLVAHTCRRDEANRLVVRVQLRNTSEVPFPAVIRVEFADKDGKLENGAERADRQEFRPGEGPPIEWTSRSDTAMSYVVDVRSGRGFPWF